MKRIWRREHGAIRKAQGRLLGSLLAIAVAASVSAHGEIRREIADPCLRSRWLLIVDPAHPGWPGRLVLKASSQGFRDDGARPATATGPLAIRAGDQVSVDQSSPILRAQFQAVALQSATVGEVLKVRLMAGRKMPLSAQGAVISVIAAGVKRARWLVTEGVTR